MPSFVVPVSLVFRFAIVPVSLRCRSCAVLVSFLRRRRRYLSLQGRSIREREGTAGRPPVRRGASLRRLALVPISFPCHFVVIPVSFRTKRRDRFFCDGTTQERKFLSLQTRFILEREGTTQGPRSRERQERSRNDPQCLGKEHRTVEKEGRTMGDLGPFRSSFLSFGSRSSFEGRSESSENNMRF